MHIRQAIYIEATPGRAMEAARTWLRDDLGELGGDVIEGRSPDGEPSITSVVVQDGIRMTTSVSASLHQSGSKLTLALRTEGVNLPARIRNLGLLPGRKLVTGQVRASLQEIKASAEEEPMSRAG